MKDFGGLSFDGMLIRRLKTIFSKLLKINCLHHFGHDLHHLGLFFYQNSNRFTAIILTKDCCI